MSKSRFSVPLLALLSLAACATGARAGPAVTPEGIAAHVTELASDAYEGREPGTAGEAKTLAYIEAAYGRIGLQPVSGDGYRLPVPLLKSEAAGGRISVGSVTLEGGETVAIRAPVAEARRAVMGDIVFAGYGISLPEQGRDDFAGIDLTGRIALVFAGLPDGTAEPSEALRRQAARAAKLANAARAGAAGVVIVYDLPPEDDVWRGAHAHAARTVLQIEGQAAGQAEVLYAVVGREAGTALARGLGADLPALKAEAAAAGFRPRLLGPGALSAENRLERFVSYNLAGALPGRKHPDEYIVYIAHWDHLGHCGTGADTICNGAVDNASGVGGLIELAEAFAKGKRPDRSVLFLATTAEESGLLGGKHFAASGPVDADRMVAAFGLDTIAANGPSDDVVVLGQGLTSLDARLAAAAKAQGRRIVAMPDAQGFYARSDHFAFAEVGVPAVIATGIFAGSGFGDYMGSHYHQPSDEVSLAIDYRGAAADMNLLLAVGQGLANSREWPAWTKLSPYQRRP
ncbi:M28 family peptidase [Sphingosinicella microcystinivorans]|uniref:M28 family peptidase n=1 Tax=Sphingosinicella microcystinivorans TaxID=335406 RepID=UPI0022F3E312|nr:M28 family peptidase [Sphingosinicella microcystinivorans]WBX83939.1 M28 family peptidase [Sphingosinicella microcystinivorans]